MVKFLFPFLLLMLFFQSIAHGQEQKNITDQNGLKQGKWITFYENSNIRYKGNFIDNEPVGEFIRYNEDGDLESKLIYSHDNDSVKAEFYHPNGFIAARGTYVEKAREGYWNFYSSNIEEYLVCRELYKRNAKEGESIKYHWNNNLAEELIYVNDKKHGPWKQYYSDGVLCIKSTYLNGKLEGLFETFFTTGDEEITGYYANDVRDGKWTFFNEDGSIKKTIIYHDGIPENRAELIREETEYLDMLEKNGGKIEDPEKKGRI